MLKANSSQIERKERNGKEKGRGKDDEGKGGRKDCGKVSAVAQRQDVSSSQDRSNKSGQAVNHWA